jgi:hypothetical protein
MSERTILDFFQSGPKAKQSENYRSILAGKNTAIDGEIRWLLLKTLPYLYTFSLYENPSFIIFSAETE